MVTLQKSEKRKDHSNRVKITLKTSDNESFQSEWESLQREWESVQKSDFHLLGELTEGQLETKQWFSFGWSGPYAFHSFEE